MRHVMILIGVISLLLSCQQNDPHSYLPAKTKAQGRFTLFDQYEDSHGRIVKIYKAEILSEGNLKEFSKGFDRDNITVICYFPEYLATIPNVSTAANFNDAWRKAYEAHPYAQFIRANDGDKFELINTAYREPTLGPDEPVFKKQHRHDR